MRGLTTRLFLPLGICISVAIFLGSTGLRPDSLGLALLALGAWMLRDTAPFAWAMCSLCLWLSLIACPNYVVFVAAVFAVALGHALVGAGRRGTKSRCAWA